MGLGGWHFLVYPQEGFLIPILREAVWDPGHVWTGVGNRKSLTFTGLRTSSRPACSKPHRLGYHSLLNIWVYEYMYIYISKFHHRTGHEGPEEEYRHSSTLSLTSALDGVGSQRHAPAALPPGKKSRYPLYVYMKLGGPRSGSGRVRKFSPPTGIRSPDLPARRKLLYRLSYPGLIYISIYIYIFVYITYLLHGAESFLRS